MGLEEYNEYYRKGYQAYLDLVPRQNCPRFEDEEAKVAWEDGWDEAAFED